MKLHQSLVENLLNLMNNYGGHKEDTKLRNALLTIDLTPYTKESGETILVDTKDYLKEITAIQRNK